MLSDLFYLLFNKKYVKSAHILPILGVLWAFFFCFEFVFVVKNKSQHVPNYAVTYDYKHDSYLRVR